MAIDWNASLQTKSFKFGLLLPSPSHELRRRVAIARDGARPSPDPAQWSRPGHEVTVWLYPEDGVSRCDRAPSDMDLVNA